MAQQSYLSIKGTKQGQFKGQSTRPSKSGQWIDVLAFDMATDAPYDSNGGNGKPTGKRTHKPIKITKKFDSTSPSLIQAVVENEMLLEVILELIDTDLPEHKRVLKRFTLTDARIKDVRPHVGPLAFKGGVVNDFTFTFGGLQEGFG